MAAQPYRAARDAQSGAGSGLQGRGGGQTSGNLRCRYSTGVSFMVSASTKCCAYRPMRSFWLRLDSPCVGSRSPAGQPPWHPELRRQEKPCTIRYVCNRMSLLANVFLPVNEAVFMVSENTIGHTVWISEGCGDAALAIKAYASALAACPGSPPCWPSGPAP